MNAVLREKLRVIVAKPYDVAFPRMPKSFGEFLKGDARYVALGSLADRDVKEKSEPFIEGLLGEYAAAKASLVCGGDDT